MRRSEDKLCVFYCAFAAFVGAMSGMMIGGFMLVEMMRLWK